MILAPWHCALLLQTYMMVKVDSETAHEWIQCVA